MIQIGKHQKESIVRSTSHGEQGRGRGNRKRSRRGAGLEGRCRSDRREWRSSGLRGKEEKKAILSHRPPMPHLCHTFHTKKYPPIPCIFHTATMFGVQTNHPPPAIISPFSPFPSLFRQSPLPPVAPTPPLRLRSRLRSPSAPLIPFPIPCVSCLVLWTLSL